MLLTGNYAVGSILRQKFWPAFMSQGVTVALGELYCPLLIRRTLDMNKRLFLNASLLFLAIFLTLCATTNIVNADEWPNKHFLYVDKDTAAIAFDAQNNLYIQPLNEDWGFATKRILMSEAPAFNNWIEYASFVSTHDGVSGLDFDDKGNLFVGEFMEDDSPINTDSGLIRKIHANSLEVSDPLFFPDYRPTGMAATGSGTLYFPARKWSDEEWGIVYLIETFKKFDPSYDPMFVTERVLTGIAVDNSGNLYGGDFNSIKTRNPYTGLPVTIAKGLGDYVEELTFDSDGNLYALMGDHHNIIRFTPPYILIDGCNTGVIDWPFPDDSTISEMIESCEDAASNHGMFVSCVVNSIIGLMHEGFVSNKQMASIVSCAGEANLP
jgi:hypothetical protein